MPTFDYSFTVPASLEEARTFYRDARTLKRLTPPPILVQLHYDEPQAEGSRVEFTLWFGPLPLRWVAVHSNVSEHGFTDTMLKGPLARWEHNRVFTAIDAKHTRISEHIAYEHRRGPWGWFTRLLFSRVALLALFTARRVLTVWHLSKR